NENTVLVNLAAICLIILFSVLPTIGDVHKNALKKNSKTFDKKDYINLPSSFIAFLVGLIDGDGYIQITRTTKGYITIKLTISLHLDDISTLEYIHSVLKLGSINIYKDLKSPTCKLVINRTELQEVLFPLLIHNDIFFLTETRVNQFNVAMHILKNNIKTYIEIPSKDNIKDVFKLPYSAYDYTLLHFFNNWIIGFTCSEGSFLLKSNNDGCFQLKQRMHNNLFEAFKLVFNTSRKIDTTNNYSQFSVSSKSDIQTVINFFSFNGLHPLIGLKYIQYTKWLKNLQNSIRYNKLKYPKL
ncbi:LAGLIDAG endonuclease, partial (mitochondrion) [Hirsutella rhossiliensis]